MSHLNKKRGCNYTATEKQILIDLVKKDLNILENKETNGDIVKKKRECWSELANQYNAVATTGPRTWKQLRHLYENLKQKTKKNVATGNKQLFLNKNEVKDVKEKASYDKMIMYLPVYCGKNVNTAEIVGNASMIKPSTLNTEINDDSTKENTDTELFPCMLPETTTNPSIHQQSRVSQTKPRGNKTLDKNKTCKKTTKLSVKDQYFRTKLMNARLERKCMLEKHKLEIELLKIKILNRLRK